MRARPRVRLPARPRVPPTGDGREEQELALSVENRISLQRTDDLKENRRGRD